MMKFHAHDTVNDIALIQTDHGLYHVRYWLHVEAHYSMGAALRAFATCQRHALAEHLPVDEDL